MKKIVFICRGNLIRSQICKAVYNKLKMDDSWAEGYGLEVEADGNEGVEIGKHEYLSVLMKIMMENGMNISHEVSKQLTEEYLKDASKIIYMGSKKNIPDWMSKYNYEYWEDCLNDVEKNKDFNLNIKVPKFGDEWDVKETILLLENKVEDLMRRIRE